MQPPIITKFGAFGSKVDCVTDESVSSATFIVPAFIVFIAVVFTYLLYKAYSLDVKDRWRRYILFIPRGLANKAPLPLSKTLEMCLTTSWKNPLYDIDLLFRVVGDSETYVTPITWIRHSYKGLFRPGFTDTVGLHYPADTGAIERIDVVSVCKQYKEREAERAENPKPSAGGILSKEDEESASASTTSNKSEASQTSSKSKSASVIKSISSIASKVSNFVPQVIKKISSAVLLFPSHEITLDTDIIVKKIKLRDPASNVRLKWQCAEKEPLFSLRPTYIGTPLRHGVPVSFFLILDDDPLNKHTIVRYLRSTFFYVLRFNPLAWVLSSRNEIHPIVINLTRIEKVFYSSFLVYHAFLVEALLHGMVAPSLWFGIETSRSVSEWMESYFTVTKIVLFFVSSVLLVAISLAGWFLSQKWTRTVEDPISYWQGTRPIYTSRKMISKGLSELMKSKDESSSENREDFDSIESTSVAQRSSVVNENEDKESVGTIPKFLMESNKPEPPLTPDEEIMLESVKAALRYAEGDPEDELNWHMEPGTSSLLTKSKKKAQPLPRAGLTTSEMIKKYPERIRLVGGWASPYPSAGAPDRNMYESLTRYTKVKRKLSRARSMASNQNIPVDVPKEVLSSLDKRSKHPKVVTHRIYEPENPFEEGRQCEYSSMKRPVHSFFRFLLVVACVVYLLAISIFISLKSSSCSEQVSFDMLLLFVVCLLVNLLVIFPISSMISALIMFFVRLVNYFR